MAFMVQINLIELGSNRLLQYYYNYCLPYKMVWNSVDGIVIENPFNNNLFIILDMV